MYQEEEIEALLIHLRYFFSLSLSLSKSNKLLNNSFYLYVVTILRDVSE